MLLNEVRRQLFRRTNVYIYIMCVCVCVCVCVCTLHPQVEIFRTVLVSVTDFLKLVYSGHQILPPLALSIYSASHLSQPASQPIRYRLFPPPFR